MIVYVEKRDDGNEGKKMVKSNQFDLFFFFYPNKLKCISQNILRIKNTVMYCTCLPTVTVHTDNNVNLLSIK